MDAWVSMDEDEPGELVDGRLAQVADADLPLLAQLAPGGRLRFRQVSLDEAMALSLAGERAIHDLAVGLAAHDG